MRHFIRRLSSVLVNYRACWHILAVFQRARFYAARWAFQSRYLASNVSANLRIFLTLARVTIPVLFLAFLCTAGIIGLALLGKRLALTFQWSPWAASLFGVVDPENRDAYDGFLAAIVTVTGVFLTLYFTGMTTLAEALYAKMPERIRNLLVRERVGNVYTRLLILLTVVSMLLLIVGIAWDFRPKMTVFLVGLLGFISIQAFVALGARAFSFFNPTSLANELLRELGRWSGQATTKGYRWDDASFQNHYRKQAHEVITGLRALVEVCHEEDHLRREALTILLTKISVFLPIYLERKRRIPSNSRWYRFTPHHKEWYLSSYWTLAKITLTQEKWGAWRPPVGTRKHWASTLFESSQCVRWRTIGD